MTAVPLIDLTGLDDEALLSLDDKFRLYNARDTHATARSFVSLLVELREAGLTAFYDMIVQPLAQTLVGMNLRGAPVDRDAQRAAISALDGEIAAMQADLNGMVGRPLNVYGPDTGRLLFEELRLAPISWSRKTGKPKCDEKVLFKLAHRVPDVATVCYQVLNIREKRKLHSMLVGLPISPDGRVYPFFRIGPATGRLGCRKPNLQNLPRGPARAIIRTRPGQVLVYADYSQVELRIIALLAHDEVYLRLFEAGADVHDHNARTLFEIAADALVSDDERRLAKNYVFSANYGGTADNVHEIMQAKLRRIIALALVRRCHVRYFAEHPAIPQWWKAIEAELRRSRRGVNSFGRPRIFFSPFADALKQAYNNPIQSDAADLMNTKMIELDRAIPNALVLQIHDAIALEVDEDHAEAAARTVKGILQAPVPQMRGYEFPAKVQIVRSLQEAA